MEACSRWEACSRLEAYSERMTRVHDWDIIGTCTYSHMADIHEYQYVHDIDIVDP